MSTQAEGPPHLTRYDDAIIHRLSDQWHMSDLIPSALRQDRESKPVAVILDGTTCLGDGLAIVMSAENKQLLVCF